MEYERLFYILSCVIERNDYGRSYSRKQQVPFFFILLL